MEGKIAVLFPGQGCLKNSMYEDFFSKSDKFSSLVKKASEISGVDIESALRELDEFELGKTDICQPMLAGTGMAIFELVKDKGIAPDYYAGYSLGEYTALGASGVMSFEDVIKLTKFRGKIMSEVCKNTDSKMAAVIYRKKLDKLMEIIEKIQRDSFLVPANYNCAGQMTVSGSKEAIDKLASMCKAEKIMVVPLTTEGGFHSELFREASKNLKDEISKYTISDDILDQKNIYANYSGTLYKDEADSLDEVVDILSIQVYSPVQFEKIINDMIDKGVKNFIEIGADVLTGFVKKTDKTLNAISIKSVEDLDNLV